MLRTHIVGLLIGDIEGRVKSAIAVDESIGATLSTIWVGAVNGFGCH